MGQNIIFIMKYWLKTYLHILQNDPLCLFHIGLVLQMMQKKEERQSARGYKVLEVEALKIQSSSMMFNTYNIQMKWSSIIVQLMWKDGIVYVVVIIQLCFNHSYVQFKKIIIPLWLFIMVIMDVLKCIVIFFMHICLWGRSSIINNKHIVTPWINYSLARWPQIVVFSLL